MPAPEMHLDGYIVRRLTERDIPALQDLFERCIDHFELHDGGPPEPDSAEIEFGDLPPGRSIADKHLHGIVDPHDHDRLIGIVESVTGYPDDLTWYLGLLLIDPKHRGSGLGRAAVEAFESMAIGAGFAQVRLSVIAPNDAGRRFWHRLGYQLDTVVADRPFWRLTHDVHVLTRPLRPLGETTTTDATALADPADDAAGPSETTRRRR